MPRLPEFWLIWSRTGRSHSATAITHLADNGRTIAIVTSVPTWC